MDFETVWKASVRHRPASREMESLLRDLHRAMGERRGQELTVALVTLLHYLASEEGRTDANCSTTYRFVTATEPEWRDVKPGLRAILDDMSGTLHETIYAPAIARTFESTPEQLLERVKALED